MVTTLIGIANHGARIGYEGETRTKLISPNHRSTYENHTVIDQAITKEVECGRVKPLGAQLPDNYVCSPLGLTPK